MQQICVFFRACKQSLNMPNDTECFSFSVRKLMRASSGLNETNMNNYLRIKMSVKRMACAGPRSMDVA